jgi:hypothetical protein
MIDTNEVLVSATISFYVEVPKKASDAEAIVLAKQAFLDTFEEWVMQGEAPDPDFLVVEPVVIGSLPEDMP